MIKKLELPQVTLICITGKDFDAHHKALLKCCEGILFGQAKIVYDESIDTIDKWNKAVIFDLWKYVDTPYAFLFHADGYIINPELWDPEWLNYDFIGAPWPLPVDNYSYRDSDGDLVRVGNSVGLRSKNLLYMPTALNLEWRPFFGNTNEDGFLCCHHRKTLEANGITFAPLGVAKYFSKEHEIPENKGLKTFAFHQV